MDHERRGNARNVQVSPGIALLTPVVGPPEHLYAQDVCFDARLP